MDQMFYLYNAFNNIKRFTNTKVGDINEEEDNANQICTSEDNKSSSSKNSCRNTLKEDPLKPVGDYREEDSKNLTESSISFDGEDANAEEADSLTNCEDDTNAQRQTPQATGAASTTEEYLALPAVSCAEKDEVAVEEPAKTEVCVETTASTSTLPSNTEAEKRGSSEVETESVLNQSQEQEPFGHSYTVDIPEQAEYLTDNSWDEEDPPVRDEQASSSHKLQEGNRSSIRSATTSPSKEQENSNMNNLEFQKVNIPGSVLDEAKGHPGYNNFVDNHSPVWKGKVPTVNNGHPLKDTIMFRDQQRRIDFVLVYREGSEEDAKIREVYQNNLEEEGFELELEDKEQSQDGQTFFLKVHAPWDVIAGYAEVMHLKKPIKRFIVIREGRVWKEHEVQANTKDLFSLLGIKNPFKYNEDLIPPEPVYFTIGFNRQRIEQFLIKDRQSFFSPAQRSQIVWEILQRIRFSEEEQEGVGINRLLARSTYVAAFPLHEGRYDIDEPTGHHNDRRLLYLEWARWGQWNKYQPLNVVRRYFGDKIALYFAWLGFYTMMLIPASILGVFTFISGIFLMYSDRNKPSEEICNKENNVTMCPLCDQVCDFWDLSDSCLNSRITFLFDNPMTVFFSVAMSFWATMFLELWKRKQSIIQWQWDLENYEDEEELRPEYERLAKTTRINPITKNKEPYLPLSNQICRHISSNSVLLLMLLVILGSVVGVIIYRLAVVVSMYKTGGELISKNAKLVTATTAATINLCLILVLNYLYEYLVLRLTDFEAPRTETEYEDSFTLKMFIFQFVNYYSSLIYIAFFKGRFFFHPGDESARQDLFQNLRYDMCDPAGCLFELFVQLAIIMGGKQFANNFVEILWPVIQVWWNKTTGHGNEKSKFYTRWEQDFDLAPFTRLSLFYEYLEMVIQYGFVTLFVAAFPLVPVLALVNNVIEIRLDAFKYLTQIRRPKADRVQDIGVWFSILRFITYASVLTNALVISYTSNFIPRMVYMYQYSPTNDLTGFVDNSLSVFNVSEFKRGMGPDENRFNRSEWPSTCRYHAYRNGPGENAYELTLQFWHVFTARLAFIIVFEHVVFGLTGIVAWAIPDVPVEVKNQMKREKKVELESLFEAERRKGRQGRQGKSKEEGTTGLPKEAPKQRIDDVLSQNQEPTLESF